MRFIYDIETLINCFTYSAVNRDTGEWVQFVIWKDKNDLSQLIEHLENCQGLIGFNNLNFDYPVLHYILKNKVKLLQDKKVANKIYKKAQDIIGQEYSAIKEADVIVPQLDLFRIWHFDNKARLTSLKKLEIALQFPNVQDMPYKHDQEITEWKQVEEILAYNKNDVEATQVFYTKTLEKLNLRRGIYQQYGINCMNFSDSKIGEELVLKLYCQHTGKMPELVKKLKTPRYSFKFSDCIPSYIKFQTPEFQELLNYLNSIEVKELKDSFKYTFEFKGFEFDLGTGGIHGCCKPGVYESNDQEIIVDVDVGSLYPSLAIANNLYPEHLGEEFLSVYENGIVKPRLEAKKEGNKVLADGYKLSANSVYGKSNSNFSFLFDPLYTLKTTLAGQLSLCMLSEMIMIGVPELKMLQINTDGLTVIIPQQHKRLYWEICKEWEKITKLSLEYVAYDRMIIRDVNNYLAITKAGKAKYKGAFKTRDEIIKDGEYHKSLSQCVVTHALSEFYLRDIPIEQTIRNHTNIYDFCKTFNASHGWKCETIDGDITELQQKNNRYFISKNGKRFRKVKDDKEIDIEANRLVTIFNQYYELPIDQYGIDYEYYIEECYKIVHKIDGTEERIAEEIRIKREQEKKEREETKFLQFCINKIPTNKQLEAHGKPWLIEKYGRPQTKEEINLVYPK